MTDYVLKFHRDEDGYDVGLEARPRKGMKLNLDELAKKFGKLHVKSSVVLVTEIEGARVSIYPDGRILLFDVDEEEGRGIVSKIFDLMAVRKEGEAKGRALFVGRFQPFHLGHLNAIKDILKENKEILIVIGSVQEEKTLENPFTLDERKRMIEKGLKEAGIKNYRILSVRDAGNDEEWADAIKKLADFDVVYTTNPWTERCFQKIGIPVKRHELYGKYSGTEIRKRILRNTDWKDLVPRSVAKFIRSVDGEERLRKLNE